MADKTTIKAMRAREAFQAQQAKLPKETVQVGAFSQHILETSAGSTTVLVYHPQTAADAHLPVFVNLHGGGFTIGSAWDDDVWCRKIANAAACVVVNVDYHLAPEHRFPMALVECYDVVKWVHDNPLALNVDPGRIAVGGHSAGGNLAAALCLLAKERGEFPLVYQVLNYPALDLSIDPFAGPSADTFLTPRDRAFFNTCYFSQPTDALSPLASPLLAADLTGLPDALIITAEHDPLRHEGNLYAERLAAAGVGVTYRMFPGCMHAFTHFGPPKMAEEAWTLIRQQLKSAFYGDGKAAPTALA